MPVLSVGPVSVVDFAPKEKVTYSKEVQTMAIETEEEEKVPGKAREDGSADTIAAGVAAISIKEEKAVDAVEAPPVPQKPRGEVADDMGNERDCRFSNVCLRAIRTGRRSKAGYSAVGILRGFRRPILKDCGTGALGDL
jgi:hypothetical protein